MSSPYDGKSNDEWPSVTRTLIDAHPLAPDDLVKLVLAAWDAVFTSKLGPFAQIGQQICPKPQIIGFLLHELVTVELEALFPGQWRGDVSSTDKDCVYIADDAYSFEIKTSSHPWKIFGNRSYAQQSSKGKKAKSGYYLAINFEDCRKVKPASIRAIRFGWLDSSDWVGQQSETGQQSSLPHALERAKLFRLYPAEN